MSFFNKKEEVLELQLTQYGKHLLSRGALSPAYYAFFDDDVIYDNQYSSGGSSNKLENSAKSSDRTRQAVRPKVQHNFGGIETNIHKLSEVKNVFNPFLDKVQQIELTQEQKVEALSKAPNSIDNYYSMGIPMGTSEYNSDKNPAWELKLLHGTITGSNAEYTGSSGLLKIPQLEVQTFYDTEVKQVKGTENIIQNVNVTKFPNGDYIEITKDYILIDFREHNALFENENFEIEVYQITTEPDTNKITETLEPLYFVNGEKVVNEIYYSGDLEKKIELNDSNVEYYFDVRVDDEIADDLQANITTDIYSKTPKNEEEPC